MSLGSTRAIVRRGVRLLHQRDAHFLTIAILYLLSFHLLTSKALPLVALRELPRRRYQTLLLGQRGLPVRSQTFAFVRG